LSATDQQFRYRVFEFTVPLRKHAGCWRGHDDRSKLLQRRASAAVDLIFSLIVLLILAIGA